MENVTERLVFLGPVWRFHRTDGDSDASGLVFMKLVARIIGSALALQIVQAHCPLCTAGAAIAAGGALWLGVKAQVIGLFVGAFAVSLGWWISNLLKKQYIPHQKAVLILVSFLTTVLPLLPIMTPLYPVYVSIAGDYGSLLNRTYATNLFLFGSIIGGLIVSSTPWLSSKLTHLRNGKQLPFQGIALTFLLLIVISAIIQLVM